MALLVALDVHQLRLPVVIILRQEGWRMKGIARVVVALMVLTAGLVMATPPAQAVTFNLTSDHCTGSCGPTGTTFGTVELVANGTGGVDFTVTLNSPFEFAKTGAANDQAFKFNGVNTVLVTDITVTSPASPVLTGDAGAFNGDGTGDFGFGIICAACGGGSSSAFSGPIKFTVASSVVSDFTIPNAAGQVFVADIFNSATSGPGFGNTGPVDASTANVAEPGSLFFFGSAMALAGMLGRRWKRRR